MSRKIKRTRRSYSAEFKATVVRRHLMDNVPVGDLCDEYNLKPSVFYVWKRQVMDNLELVLTRGSKDEDRERRALEREIAKLRERLSHKDGVIAEVAAEMVHLKKELGEL